MADSCLGTVACTKLTRWFIYGSFLASTPLGDDRDRLRFFTLFPSCLSQSHSPERVEFCDKPPQSHQFIASGSLSSSVLCSRDFARAR